MSWDVHVVNANIVFLSLWLYNTVEPRYLELAYLE